MDNEKKKFAVIVVNDKSGRGKRANVDKLKKTMLKTYDVRVFHITDGEGFSYVPCDVIAVFGGDGTLNSVVNMYADKETKIIYVPSGTLNECSKNALKYGKKSSISPRSLSCFGAAIVKR